MANIKEQILKALREQGHKVLYVKGIYVFENGERLSTTKAAKLAGIKVKSKSRKPKTTQPLYGDFAWLVGINRIKS